MLRDAPAPHLFAGVVLGLALIGCGGREDCEEGATTASSAGSAMTDAACGQSSAQETEAGGGEDYAGPEPTEDTYEPPDDTTEGESASESTGADTTGGESTTGDTTSAESTETGDTTGATTESEGSSGSDSGEGTGTSTG